ncbi:hypothetical protein DFS34DRAFT_693673, partial [Phlyctochytrium arcticum]
MRRPCLSIVTHHPYNEKIQLSLPSVCTSRHRTLSLVHHHSMYWQQGKRLVEMFDSRTITAEERFKETQILIAQAEREIVQDFPDIPLSDARYKSQFKAFRDFESTCRRLYEITRYLGVGVIGCEENCKWGRASAYLELTRTERKKGALVQGEFEKVLDMIRNGCLRVPSSVNDEAYENYLGIDDIHSFYHPYYFYVVAPHRKQLFITWTPQDRTLMDINTQQVPSVIAIPAGSTIDDVPIIDNDIDFPEFEFEEESEEDEFDSAPSTGSPTPAPLPSSAW